MLISGGGLRFAQPPAVGRRPTAGGTKLRFRSSADAGGPVNFATKRNEWHRLLQNASKCSEAFRNAMARMTYCLGHPAIVASIGPVIPSANLCKNLYNFVNFCIRKQNFAELTPVHPVDAALVDHRQVDGVQTGDRRIKDLAAAQRHKSVAEGHRRCQIQRRHRGHPSAGKPRRLIAPVTQNPA